MFLAFLKLGLNLISFLFVPSTVWVNVSQFFAYDFSSLLPGMSICKFYFYFFITGREERLTEHAMQWNRRKIEGLARSLSKRYEKVLKTLSIIRYSCTVAFFVFGN